MNKKKNSKSIPKQIAWLHPHFYNWMGGHQYILEVAQRLQNEYGYSITIYTAGLSPKAKAKFTAAKIQTRSLLGISTSSPVYWVFLPVFLFFEYLILKWRYKLSPHSIIISSMFPATFVAKMLTKHSLILCYEPFAFFYDQNFLSGFSAPTRVFFKIMKELYGTLDSDALHAAKAIITLSAYNRLWIRKCYGAVKMLIAYEGVDTDFFKPTKNVQLSKKYQKYQVIFHSTDYTSIKGTEYLIQAIPLIKKVIPNLRLIISETLPDSLYKKNITKLVKKLKVSDVVEFVGFLPYELLPAYLSLARLVVQPSIQQSMNMTIKEAMACRTAIITSPEGKEQTANGEAGFLVAPQDTQKLSEQIVKCLKNDRIVSQMGTRGLDIIKKKFSWDRVTKVFAQELQEV